MMKKIYKYFRLLLAYKGTAADIAALLWRFAVKLFYSFSFYKLDLKATVGMDKPDNLGYTIGAVEAVKAFFKNKKAAVQIRPDYCNENYIYGEMDFAVRFHIYKFIKNMMMLAYEAMWKKNLRKTIWREISKLAAKYIFKK
ncbi:MAG TPA: hypothetical protein PK467_07510 [Candidatus Wallbacteria bacterium]|nr:hypothetical protein [Candidatus Wallbacteria bacterium]